jgi:peptidyl-prolyl cis-trans isomerase B (cyclophilin B)
MKKAVLLFLLPVFFSLFRFAADGKEIPKVAVWDLAAREVKASYAQELTSILASEVAKLNQYEVYSQENVRTLAGWTEERMKLGCTGTQCLTALGQMDIAKLISGSVGRIGNRYSISLNLFDTQNARAENMVSEFCGSEDELIELVQTAVNKLLRTGRTVSAAAANTGRTPAGQVSPPRGRGSPDSATAGTTVAAGSGKTYKTEEIRRMAETTAIIETKLGKIELKFFPDVAPGHVKNFIDLAKKGFYDGTTFHRVIPGFMIQGGDPNTKGTDRSNHGMGGPGYTIKAEFSAKPHKRGVMSMARAQDPNSAGSQFFICVADASFLDRQYTAFGEVVSGMDVADKIVSQSRDKRDNPNERIELKVKIVEKEG